jgi:pyruvate dehydrogenase E2 component (dihydrolipoyllysine-residue acetyltransferase)
VIAAWHKKVGDSVKKGDLLAEVETDKATMELESYKDGTLLHIGTEKGGKLQVNDLLAIIGAKGEDISSLIKGGGQATEKKAGEKKEVRSQKSEVGNQAPKSPEEKSEPKTQKSVANQPAAGNQKSETATLDISKMEEVVLMPRLSDTMTEGVIAAWQKNVGDKVKKGDILAEIETDKATMELESYKNGTLLYQGAAKGEKIEVNALLCIIGEKDKVDVNAIVAAAKGGVSQQSTVDSPQPVAENAKAASKPETEKEGGTWKRRWWQNCKSGC